MKRIQRHLSLLLFLLCITACLTFTAFADDAEKIDATDGMTLTVSREMGIVGNTVEVTIDLSNNQGLASLIFEVAYDDCLTLTDVRFNETVFSGNTFVKDEPAAYANPQRLSFMSPIEENTGNGLFATLIFEIGEETPDGYLAEISISSYDPENVFDGEFNNIPLTCVSGGIVIYRGLPGDVNGDGEVNNKDAIALFRYVAGSSITVDPAALDVNGDREINNKDAITLFRYVAGWEGIEIHRGLICEHNYETVDAKEATCTEDGYTKHTQCTVCGDKIGYIKLPASHNYNSVSGKEPTCTESGYTAHEKCSACGNRRGYEVIDALGHLTEDHAAKQPTCETVGWNAYETCVRCNYSTKVEVPALGHDYETVSAEAKTCYQDGHSAYLDCSRCESVVGYERIPASHEYTTIHAKEATCTENGYETHQRCSDCGETIGYVEIPAAHTYVSVDSRAPACKDGYTEHELCIACGDTVGYEIIPAVGHVANSDHICVECGLKELSITIRYIYDDGSAAAESTVLTVWEGDTYYVVSPTIDGFINNIAIVSGYAAQSEIITVTYIPVGTLFGGYDESGNDFYWDLL